MIKFSTENLTQHVKGKSTFKHLSSFTAVYKTDTGLEFEVPIEDIDNGYLYPEMKSIQLMKWIRKKLGWYDEMYKSLARERLLPENFFEADYD